MKHALRNGALALLLGLLPSQALAQSPEAGAENISDVNIAGEWTFVANTGPECTFSGSALLTPTDEPGRFDCELTAIQVCSVETWQVRQTCLAYRSGDEVVIASEIVEFVEGGPSQAYRPDNFKLTIKSADRMKGVLISWGYHTAEFLRTEGSIS